MKVIVTGCAGLIGWKVSQLLLERGDKVIGIDNLNDAYDVTLKEWRLDQLKGNFGFEFQQIDCSQLSSLQKIGQPSNGIKPDAVINLAARAGVRHSIIDPWIYYKTNVIGTLNLLDYCREKEIPKFVLASSSSVYGDQEQQPSLESNPTDQPCSPYAASKKSAEGLCYTYHHNHSLDISALRYFTVYGPAGRPDMAVFRFIKWIESGEPVTVFGDGFHRRDFTYVDDIALGTIAALKPVDFEAINLGNDHPTSVNDMIHMLENLLNKRANISYLPANPADVEITWANIAKAKTVLDWSPRTSLLEGLSRTVDWYRQNESWASKISV